MKKNILLWISLMLFIAAAAGVAFAVDSANKRKAAEAKATELREQIARMQAYIPDADTPDDANRAATTNELDDLKALLARKDEEIAALKTTTPSAPTNQPPQRESWEDRMTRMKEEDPEGYAEMIQRREERRQEMRYSFAERTATFMDLDTSFMSDEEHTNHDLLVDKMAQVWELTKRFEDAESPPDRELRRELFETLQETRPLMDQERNVMLRQLGRDLGYEEEDAQAFADYTEEIISTTTLQMPRGGGPRRGP